jgi:hypothetical protein
MDNELTNTAVSIDNVNTRDFSKEGYKGGGEIYQGNPSNERSTNSSIGTSNAKSAKSAKNTVSREDEEMEDEKEQLGSLYEDKNVNTDAENIQNLSRKSDTLPKNRQTSKPKYQATSKKRTKTEKSIETDPKVTEETRKRNKTTIIIVFVVLGIIMIIYAIYMFEAYKKKWFPFLVYTVESAPVGGVLVNGPTSANVPVVPIDPEDENYKDVASQIVQVNQEWYKSPNAIPLPPDQK